MDSPGRENQGKARPGTCPNPSYRLYGENSLTRNQGLQWRAAVPDAAIARSATGNRMCFVPAPESIRVQTYSPQFTVRTRCAPDSTRYLRVAAANSLGPRAP